MYSFSYNPQMKCFRTHVDINILSCFGMGNSCPKCVRTFQLHPVYETTWDHIPEDLLFIFIALITSNLNLNVVVDQVEGKSAMRREWPAFPNATWLRTYTTGMFDARVIRPASPRTTRWRVRTDIHCKTTWLTNAAGCLNTILVTDSFVNYKQIGFFYKCELSLISKGLERLNFFALGFRITRLPNSLSSSSWESRRSARRVSDGMSSTASKTF
jgi:hypothetical protein